MNTIKCPACRFENAFGLAFCTNCGATLYSQAETGGASAGRPPSNAPDTLQYRAADTMNQPKKSSSQFLLIGGVIAVMLLVLGAVVLSAFFYYLGSRNKEVAANQKVDNTSVSVSNKGIANKALANRKTGNKVNANSSEIDDTNIEENPITLPPAVGPYEQQEITVGSAAQDFVGADSVEKATYVKKGKEVVFVLAKFTDREQATEGYNQFLSGLRNSGAKVVAKRKIKNKAGINNGDLSLLTFEKKWNTLAYSDKHGIRFIAPDRYTLLEFAREFDKIFSGK